MVALNKSFLELVHSETHSLRVQCCHAPWESRRCHPVLRMCLFWSAGRCKHGQTSRSMLDWISTQIFTALGSFWWMMLGYFFCQDSRALGALLVPNIFRNSSISTTFYGQVSIPPIHHGPIVGMEELVMVVMELHWCLPHQPSQERLLLEPKPRVVLQQPRNSHCYRIWFRNMFEILWPSAFQHHQRLIRKQMWTQSAWNTDIQYIDNGFWSHVDIKDW